jgi:prepilin-type processing-associated H-X9-DG protein/prepilin-type N-terminal cleavage/methylation domain-containing protein
VRNSSRRAFTLVELLVVIGIIAVLIALLMPALSAVRKKAQAVVCASHLRSIGQAMAMYTTRYGCYPSCYLRDFRETYALWPVRLRPFTGGDQRVFYCPAQDERCEWQKVDAAPGAPGRANEAHAAFGYEIGEPLMSQSGTYFSYAYNGYGGSGTSLEFGAGAGLGQYLDINPDVMKLLGLREQRVTRVRRPAEMVAVIDTTADALGDFGSGGQPPYPTVFPGIIHNGGANALFCDGHVQWFVQKDLMVTFDRTLESDNYIRRMWNFDHRLQNGNTSDY